MALRFVEQMCAETDLGVICAVGGFVSILKTIVTLGWLRTRLVVQVVT